MDWKAWLVSSIEAAVEAAMEAAVEASVKHAVQPAIKEMRGYTDGSKQRIRQEIEEIRHARAVGFHNVDTTASLMPAATTTKTSINHGATLRLGNDRGMAASHGADLAAMSPATCSTQCPSRAVIGSVSAPAPTATLASSKVTVGVVPERGCFDLEPAAVASSPTPMLDISGDRSTVVNSLTHDAVSNTSSAMASVRALTSTHIPSAVPMDSTPASVLAAVSAQEMRLGYIRPSTCTTKNLGDDTNMASTSSSQMVVPASSASTPALLATVSASFMGSAAGELLEGGDKVTSPSSTYVDAVVPVTTNKVKIAALRPAKPFTEHKLIGVESLHTSWTPARSTACRLFNMQGTLYVMQLSGDLQDLETVEPTGNATLTVIIFVPGVQTTQLNPTVFKWSDLFCFDTHFLAASTFDFLLARQAAHTVIGSWCCEIQSKEIIVERPYWQLFAEISLEALKLSWLPPQGIFCIPLKNSLLKKSIGISRQFYWEGTNSFAVVLALSSQWYEQNKFSLLEHGLCGVFFSAWYIRRRSIAILWLTSCRKPWPSWETCLGLHVMDGEQKTEPVIGCLIFCTHIEKDNQSACKTLIRCCPKIPLLEFVVKLANLREKFQRYFIILVHMKRWPFWELTLMIVTLASVIPDTHQMLAQSQWVPGDSKIKLWNIRMISQCVTSHDLLALSWDLGQRSINSTAIIRARGSVFIHQLGLNSSYKHQQRQVFTTSSELVISHGLAWVACFLDACEILGPDFDALALLTIGPPLKYICTRDQWEIAWSLLGFNHCQWQPVPWSPFSSLVRCSIEDGLFGSFSHVKRIFQPRYLEASEYLSSAADSVPYHCAPVTAGMVFPYGSVSLWKFAWSSWIDSLRVIQNTSALWSCILWAHIHTTNSVMDKKSPSLLDYLLQYCDARQVHLLSRILDVQLLLELARRSKQAGSKGRRNAAAPPYCCDQDLDQAYYFNQVYVNQHYYLDAFCDQVNISDDYFLEQVGVIC